MSNKHLSIVAAAAMAVAGMGFTAHAQDARPADDSNVLERAADKTGDALNRAGDATKDTLGIGDRRANAGPAANTEEINDILAQVAEAAVTKGGLNDLVERLVDADRNRLGQDEAALEDNQELNGRIAQLQKDWKDKYDQDFDIKDEDAVYSMAMIHEGELGDASATPRTASDRVGVGADVDVNADAGRANVDVDNKTGVDAPKINTDGQTAADRNLNDPGRNIASVTFPASHGMPEVKVPLIHEAGGWKIDIPDSVNATKLRDNVLNALTQCNEMKDKWPADANAAYSAVTHSVLLAIMDKPLMDDAQKASDQQAPQADQQRQPAAQPE